MSIQCKPHLLDAIAALDGTGVALADGGVSAGDRIGSSKDGESEEEKEEEGRDTGKHIVQCCR